MIGIAPKYKIITGCICFMLKMAIAEMIKPKDKLPLSPIKIFAGDQLKSIKAIKTDMVKIESKNISSSLKTKPT